MVTRKEQVALPRFVSVAVQFTVVVPIGKTASDGGTHTTGRPAGSVPTVNWTTALDFPRSVDCTMFVEQVMLGSTVTRLEHVALPKLSITLNVTVCCP